MSKSRLNTLITASVMSAVYLAGVSNVSYAVDLQTDASIGNDNNSMTAVLNHDNHSVLPAANAAGQRRYIIRFKEAPVARYNGAGDFPAIPRMADNKIDVSSPAVANYVSHLKQQQTNFLNQLSNQLGRQVNSILSYQYATNGMAVYLTSQEAAQVKSFNEIASVNLDRDYTLDTDAGPQLIGADNIWNGAAPASGTAYGEGVVIGTLDSGTNFDHPSFADVGGDGYDHTNPLGTGNYLGVCDPSNTEQYLATYTCNDKLIGGYDFVFDLVPADGSVDIPGPEDENGHGTHTSSTSGGNVVLTAEANGVTDIAISGVAPHATNIQYDICFTNPVGQGLCPGASSLAAMDQVIADGIVDVVNYSIGGGTSPWTDDVSLAFLAATDSGVFVSASAGNSGPGAGTLGHVEPWTASVGASTHNRTFVNLMSITSPPGDTDPTLTDIEYNTSNGPAAGGDINAGIEYAGNVDAGNFEGCAAFPASSFDGLVALISRGSCSFEDKVNNAFAAGAVAAVIHNNEAGALNMDVAGAQDIPSFSVTQADGTALATYLGANAAQTVEILMPAIAYNGEADVMAGFSSRGPSPFEYNKPDVTGPGVNILAAFDDSDPATGTPEEYGIISGTSMSSPHNAGAAALLKELNPTWTAAEIKSALMLTAVTDGVTKEDGVTPADPFDRGAGRIQVDTASATGLVMNETAFKFLMADPANGGDPKDLNVASYKNDNCVGTCSFTRKFTSVASDPVDYVASLDGMSGTVTPSSFTAMPGQTITLDVEIDGSSVPAGVVSFGELQIVPQNPLSSNPNLAIPDDGYDGSLGSMACESLNVSGLPGSVPDVSLELAMSHTWVGDLTIKVQNPNGDILGVMSRPGLEETADDGTGCCGDSSALTDIAPISFFDGASNSAEDLGSLSGFGGLVCDSDGQCEFSPAPDTVAVPPATFADLLATDPNGTWNICFGDSGGGDTGTVSTVSLSFPGFAADLPPDMHLPLVVTGFPEQPDIDVTPASLSATLDPDMTTDLNLNISNSPVAGADLNWSFGSGVINTDYVDQQADPGIANTGFAGNLYAGSGNVGAYIADDYTSTSNTIIESMFFEGFITDDGVNPAPPLTDTATAFNVQFFENNNTGGPDGDPEGTTGTPVAVLNIPINDPSLTIIDGNISIDVVAANGGSPLNIPAGTYWVSAFASQIGANGDPGAWVWFVAGDTPAGGTAKLISPVLFGITSWTNAPSLFGAPNNVLFEKMRFNLSGPVGAECGAPWISTSPSGGALTPGNDEDVTVTLDSTGLSPGEYTGYICVDSDDPDEVRTVIPVTMTVGLSDLIFENGFEAVVP